MMILLVVVHILVCLFLVGVVLVQQGKSADLAAAFGGSGSQTAFGPRGAANLLTKMTAWGAVIFMCTSIGLTIAMAHGNGSRSVLPTSRARARPPRSKDAQTLQSAGFGLRFCFFGCGECQA